MAVPGRILDEAYKGANGLIKQGARLIEDIGDIVSCCFPDVEFSPKPAIDINEDEDYIYRLMGIDRIHVDELIEKSRFETRKVMAILTRLEDEGDDKADPRRLLYKEGLSGEITACC